MKKVVMVLSVLVVVISLVGCGKDFSCNLTAPSGGNWELSLSNWDSEVYFTNIEGNAFTAKDSSSHELKGYFISKEDADILVENNEEIVVGLMNFNVMFFDRDENGNCFGAILFLQSENRDVIQIDNLSGDCASIMNFVGSLTITVVE